MSIRSLIKMGSVDGNGPSPAALRSVGLALSLKGEGVQQQTVSFSLQGEGGRRPDEGPLLVLGTRHWINTLFLTSVVALLTIAFVPSAWAGGGGTATVSPTQVAEGSQVTATLNFIVPAGGMAAGSVIQITMPIGWGPSLQAANSSQPGFVSSSGGSITLAQGSAQGSIVATLSNSLSASSAIQFNFTNVFAGCPQPAQTTAVWTVQSSASSSDTPAALANSPTETYMLGTAQQLTYNPWTPITVAVNQPSLPLVIRTADNCGQVVTVSSAPIVVGFTSQDPNGQFASASSSGSYVSSLNLSILSGASSATYYYLTPTAGSNSSVIGTYQNPVNGTQQHIYRQVNALANAPSFGALSVDGGTPVAGQTTFTMTPDGDGTNDSAFIRFSPSDSTQNWHVTISNDNFATIVYERFGVGNPQGTLSWDARNQFQANAVFVPNGTYAVKVEFPGFTPDTSLSLAVVSSQISGTVSSGGTPVSGAFVTGQNTTGPGYSSAMTDVSGAYILRGLKAGNVYSLSASYTNGASPIPVTGQLLNIPAPSTGNNFPLVTPAVIRVSAVSTSSSPAMVYGNLNAHSADFTKNFYGNLRLQQGAFKSDNGDYFNPSTWTVLYVSPGSYVMHLSIQGYGATDQTVSASAGLFTDVTIPLTAKASVYGLIVLPAPVTQNTFVPVQATRVGQTNTSLYGGASFSVGQSSSVYSIYAVDPGVYQFQASPTGLIPLKTGNVTIGTADIGNSTSGSGGVVDFTSFSTGDSLAGQITIVGDTTAQPNPFTLWVSAYSPTLGANAFTQVQVPTSSTSTSVSYQLSGLAPGSYQIYSPYLAGFESTSGQPTMTISSTVNVLNMTLTQDTGLITGTITLPSGATDYDQVHLSLQGPVSIEENVPLPGPTYTIPNLGSGYYSLVATYLHSGAQAQTYTVLTNGRSQTLDLNLSAPTFGISGTVSVQSGFSIKSSSGSLVPINTMSDLLADATNQTLSFGGNAYSNCSGGTSQIVSTARVEAFPKNFNSYNNSTRNNFSNCYGIGQYNFATLDSSGNYHLSGLTPGVWEVDVYPYFDNGQSPNVATVQQFVTVSNASVNGVNFGLSNGNSVSGTVTLPSGVFDVQTLSAQILDSQGNLNQQATLQIGAAGSPATSTPFQFANLPAGTYSLLVQDQTVVDPVSGQNVTKYVAKPIQFTVSGVDLTGQTVTLSNASRIIGKIAIQQVNPQDGTISLTQITSANSNLLPSNFSIFADPNPNVQGAGRSANFSNSGSGISFDSNSQFTIDGLQPGLYDVTFQQNSYSASFQGQGSLNVASYTQGSVTVPLGQTVDLGTVTLLPGITISGIVTDQSNHPLGNIVVRAQASNSQNNGGSTQSFTDSQGHFSLAGLSPTFKIYDITAAPHVSPGDNTQPVPYGQVTLKAIDVTKISAAGVSFALPSATASLVGHIVTVDGGALSYPQGDQAGYPEAAIFVRPEGNVDEDNPLGDDYATNLDGSFTISDLPAGVYDVTVESLGYRPLRLTGVSLGTGVKDLGTLTLQSGPSLKTLLVKPDGSAVSTNDVEFAVAVTADLSNILFGRVNSDANTNNINSIQFSGFDLSPTVYSVLLFDKQSNITAPVEGRNIVFTSTSDALVRTLTFAQSAPTVLTHLLASNGSVLITYYFSRPLRNRLDDQDPSQWLNVTSGPSNLSGYVLSGDRRQLSILYTPVAGQQNATIAFAAHTIDIDPSTGSEFAITKTITVLLGQKATAEAGINPVLGGSVSLSDDQDPSGIRIPSNALLTSSGSAVNSGSNYTVTFTATNDPTTIPLSAGTLRSKALSVMAQRGPGAYVSEAFSAMSQAQIQDVNPLSSFYSVLLPAGLSHSLNQTSFITLSYNSAITDPSQINVYYFNGTQYLLEQNQRVVDPVNHTITVGVSHFSTFVVLLNHAPIVFVTGGPAAVSSQFEVHNFPNPFNLVTKTKALANGGGTATLTTEGTIIRYSIPSEYAGSADILIFDAVGEKVRELNLGTPATNVENYVTWDGRNSSGHPVASGVYIGELKVGGQKRFWKMAVIK